METNYVLYGVVKESMPLAAIRAEGGLTLAEVRALAQARYERPFDQAVVWVQHNGGAWSCLNYPITDWLKMAGKTQSLVEYRKWVAERIGTKTPML